MDRLPALASFLASERKRLEAAGIRVLHTDAGDFFQGTPEGDLTRGRAVLEAFNEMGLDALVPGNHDFDPGPAVTEDLARAARFPFLAANLRGARGPPAWVRPSLVRTDLRLEILGLATDAMVRLSTRRAREGLEFESAPRAIEAHRWTPGVARIVASHLGLERDRALPLQGIAAVLGGHTHVTAAEQLPGGAWLLHPGSHGASIARLELELDPATGTVRASRGVVIDVPDGRHDAVEAILERRSGDIRRTMAEPVGALEADLSRGGPEFDGRSSPLGNHVADLARDTAGAEAAVILRSSIRASLFEGAVRRRDLYEATPFPDTIVEVSVTGAKLRGALERAVADDERLLVEVSGIAMEYDRAAPRGRRIRRLTVAGSDLQPSRRYRVATLSLMTEPRGLFSGAPPRDTGRTLFEAHLGRWRTRPRQPPVTYEPRVSGR